MSGAEPAFAMTWPSQWFRVRVTCLVDHAPRLRCGHCASWGAAGARCVQGRSLCPEQGHRSTTDTGCKQRCPPPVRCREVGGQCPLQVASQADLPPPTGQPWARARPSARSSGSAMTARLASPLAFVSGGTARRRPSSQPCFPSEGALWLTCVSVFRGSDILSR